ncbi:hypothetical protein BH09ACT8_BH09ACT8_59930 [soil metagenome]
MSNVSGLRTNSTAAPTGTPQSAAPDPIVSFYFGNGTVKDYPKYGDLTVDATTGKYTYTPDADLVRPGITDRFTLTVNNGATAQLDGFAGVMQNLLHGLAIAPGAAQPDSVDRQITVTVTGDRRYGDATNSKWWIRSRATGTAC